MLPLWYENGYDADDIDTYFQGGAKGFTIYENDTPVSTCIIFRNSEAVWEIGAVRTIPAHRNKGYGKIVTGAALNYLLSIGKIPNYQVSDANTASVRLAHSLGMDPVVTLKHFYYTVM